MGAESGKMLDNRGQKNEERAKGTEKRAQVKNTCNHEYGAKVVLEPGKED